MILVLSLIYYRNQTAYVGYLSLPSSVFYSSLRGLKTPPVEVFSGGESYYPFNAAYYYTLHILVSCMLSCPPCPMCLTSGLLVAIHL
jgi:hypothetical protein